MPESQNTLQDISVLSIAGNSYTIKDATAREGVINKRNGETLPIWEGTEEQWNGGGSTLYYNWSGNKIFAQDVDIQDYTVPSMSNLYYAVFGNNIFVAADEDGKVKYSTDNGSTWNDSNISSHIITLIFGNGIFVAFKASSTKIYISSNGRDWTEYDTGLSNDIKCIGFGNGIFLLGTTNKEFYTSTDAQTWTFASSAEHGIYVVERKIGFANNKFIFVDAFNIYDGTYYIKTSPDGINWTLIDTLTAYDPDYLWASAIGNVMYWGIDNTKKASTDGGTTIQTIDDRVIYINSITFGDNAYYKSTNSGILTSNDGITWSTFISYTYNSQNGIAYGNNTLINVGGYSESGAYHQRIIKVSLGSSIYTIDEHPTTSSVIYSIPGKISELTITSVDTGTITCSDDNTYTYDSTGNQTGVSSIGISHPDWLCNIEGVGVKKGTTLIASQTLVDQTYDGTSTNAQSGTAIAEVLSEIPTADNSTIINNNSHLQATGLINKNTVYSATNPLEFWEGTETQWNNGVTQTWYNWQTNHTGININATSIQFSPNEIVYGNGKYVAVGADGKIMSSDDEGVTWTAETSGVNVTLNSIAYGNNTFIAVGNGGIILVSSGNGTWISTTLGNTDRLSIVFGNNTFITNGYRSTDNGETWVSASGYLYYAYANGKFYACSSKLWPNEDISIYSSTNNGASWTSTRVARSGDLAGTSFKLIGYGNVVIYGYTRGTSMLDNYYVYSTNGTTWTSGGSSIVDGIYDDINSKYYILASGRLYASSNGISTTTTTNLGSVSNIGYLANHGDNFIGVGTTYSNNLNVMTYGTYTLRVYTLDEHPTTSSIVYSAPKTSTYLDILSVDGNSFSCSDGNTYTYYSEGNQTTTSSIGEVHPSWICNIEGVGVKKGTTLIAEKNINAIVDQIYNSSSTNSQSGTAVAGAISTKQDTLVSGTNIKTVNNQSLLGSGNLEIDISTKQDTLVSGINIKTVNDQSLLGSGNLEIDISIDTDNNTINKNSSDELQAIGVQDARTDTAIRLWTGSQTQYNNGGSVTFYNWQSGVTPTFNQGGTLPTSYPGGLVAFGNNTFMTVRDDGTSTKAVRSTDNGISWETCTSMNELPTYSIAFGNGRFVIAGRNSNICAYTDDNGNSWSYSTMPYETRWRSIAYGNSTFVAVSQRNGYAAYSIDDGETWQSSTLPNNNAYYTSVAFGNGVFVTTANSSADAAYSTDNGKTWTATSLPSTKSWGNLVFGNNIFFVTSFDNQYAAKSTDNGQTWTAVTLPSGFSYGSRIIFGNGYFVITSADKTSYSTDCVNWKTISNSGFTAALVGAYGNNRYMWTSGTIVKYVIINDTSSVYTTDQNPTTSSIVYDNTTTQSALTITSVSSNTITLSDTNTYNYNSAGNQTVSQTVGQVHPDWLCNIENIGIKKGDSLYAEKNSTVDQTFNASSTNAQSGVAVANAIDSAISSTYKAAGSIAFASLPTLSSANEGKVYNVTDAFTTTSDFVEGSGKSYPAGTNVVIINTEGTTYKYDVLAGFVDLSNYVLTSRTINGKALTSDITLTASDVSALPSSTVIPTITDTYSSTSSDGMSGKAVASAISDKQDSNTAVTHTASTAVGSATQPVYIAGNGTATAITYELNKTVPADAIFTDTTYSAFTGADGSTAGSAGLVPAPTASDNTKFLKGDGTWATADTNIAYDNVTINENSNNELQTIGVINQRDESTLKIWHGTQAQWNQGESIPWYYWQTSETISNYYSTFYFDNYATTKNVTYDGEFYFGLGTSSRIVRSRDGETWEELSNLPSNIVDIAYGNGKLIVLCTSGFAYSTDKGNTWTEISDSRCSSYNQITFVGNYFIVLSDYEDAVTISKILFSDNGTTWSESNTLPTTVTSAASDGNIYVMTSTSSNIYYSYDLINWTTITLTYDQYIFPRCMTYGNGVFVILTRAGKSRSLKFKYSTDGINWNDTSQIVYKSTSGGSISFGANKFIVLLMNQIFTSTDGVSWAQIATLSNSPNFYKTCYGDKKFISSVYHNSNFYINALDSLSCFTDTATPTTTSTVYSAPNTASTLTVSSVTSGAITLSNNNTYYYDATGNTSTYRTIGEVHPDYLCFITNVGIKIGNTNITPLVTTSITSSSTDTEVPSAKAVYDTVGEVETSLNNINSGE